MRRLSVRTLKDAHGDPRLNGIDYLEVEAAARQITLYFINSKGLPLNDGNITISGTSKVKFTIDAGASQGNVLCLTYSPPVDFSTYTLRLIKSPIDAGPPDSFDPMLSEIGFSFKIDCINDFDCSRPAVCPPVRPDEPRIDYLARDYASFRRLMLDRMSLVSPGWKEQSPADVGIALVELIAYAADRLSYYQDAVATEAYLGTARKRTSIRRHVRLLDYRMHDGCNARVWVQIRVNADNVQMIKGTKLLSRFTDGKPYIGADDTELLGMAMEQQACVFETLHDVTLYKAHDRIEFYTWGDGQCCLPAGATKATLTNHKDGPLSLKVGDVLVFKEEKAPVSGAADPTHRHAVRLTAVKDRDKEDHLLCDPLFPDKNIVEIEWAPEDAPPFPLCLWETDDESSPSGKSPVSIALGNIVLADHGDSIGPEQLTVKYGAPVTLSKSPVTQRHELTRDDLKKPASAAMAWDIADAMPGISLTDEDGLKWQPKRDLIDSAELSRDFVLETDEEGTAHLRFGDDVLGKDPVPEPGTEVTMSVNYRIGNGRAGNVGPDVIAHAVLDDSGIIAVTNPMAAQGGMDPEPMETARLNAPQAFQVQDRAVTEDDYGEVAQRHPEVQKAVATLRWTGSWHTMYVNVDRIGGRDVDDAFREDLLSFLGRYRMAGYDLEINAPIFVPLDVAMDICVAPGYIKANVKQALFDVFSNIDLPDGARGLFHPDNFTFGQPVYLSRLVAAAMKVPGVDRVAVTRFRRWKKADEGEIDKGCIPMDRLEIAQLDNDPDKPGNGKIEFNMGGGL